MTTFPTVDRDQIEMFVEACFRYADDGGYVSLRAFLDDRDGPWEPSSWPVTLINGHALRPVVENAARFAEECANATEKVVFAPPIATFRSANGAAEKDVQWTGDLGRV